MAIFYTNNLTGNDSTGDGSIALPFKTINRAMTVGTNGDEIRVAGSGWTVLSGTVTATTVGATTWNTSQNLTGVLLPGDIITVNDAEFGDQKFFYKVFSVGTSSIVVDGAWNRTPNTNLTFSKITTQHYYTTSTGQTFENVNISGKDNFKITGGWVNNYTEQTGWTVMNFQGATATANSGTGFTAITGGAGGQMYFDRFMLSHLTTGFAGSTNRWFPGTLAFVYFNTASPFGANPVTVNQYSIPDIYYTNSIHPNILGGSTTLTNSAPQLQFNNMWYANTVSTSQSATSGIATKCTNIYSRSSFASGVQSYGSIPCFYMTVDNVYLATQQAVGTIENIILFANNGGQGGASYVTNDIQILGPNTGSQARLILANNGSTTNNQIRLATKRIEDFPLVSNGYNANVMFPTGNVIDIDGEKAIYNNSCIAYADSSQFSTGTNSLRLYTVTGANSIAARVPIESIYINNSNARTITIRARSSSNATVSFGLWTGRISYGTNNGTQSTIMYKSQDFALTTSWTDYTFTGLDASTAALLLNSYVALVARVDSVAGSPQYIWIDSVTIS